MKQPRNIPTTRMATATGAVLLMLAAGAFGEPALGATDLDNPGTLYACVTPAGTMYLIKQPGLKQECEGNHQMISFIEEGPVGLSGYQLVVTELELFRAVAECPAGTGVLGGGFATGGHTTVGVANNRPIELPGDGSSTREGWLVEVNDVVEVSAYAICAIVEE